MVWFFCVFLVRVNRLIWFLVNVMVCLKLSDFICLSVYSLCWMVDGDLLISCVSSVLIVLLSVFGLVILLMRLVVSVWFVFIGLFVRYNVFSMWCGN